MDIKYDYLIVGTGLFASVFAYHAKKMGKKCLMIDRRSHLGGIEPQCPDLSVLYL